MRLMTISRPAAIIKLLLKNTKSTAMKKLEFKLLLCSLFLLLPICVLAQNTRHISGVIHGIDNKGKKDLLTGAIIELPGAGIGTQSDAEGKFMLMMPDSATRLVVSYIGYRNDTVRLKPGVDELNIEITQEHKLKEVVVSHRQKSTEMGLLGTIKTEKIGKKELFKAACCNLSESFETTPSVDVAFTDAVTGYKQIMMLGLAGSYTLITRENIPDVRGLASVTGLTFTPGTWIEGMQLSKGSGSVINGYEGMAGQINVELQKPFEGEKWFMNMYQSTEGRSEVNLNYRHKISEKLGTNLLLHATSQWLKVDQNKDGFIDQPLGNQFSGINRWYYDASRGWEFQGGIKGIYTDNVGGQWAFTKGMEQVAGNPWGYTASIRRLEEWAKIAKIFTQRPATSVGLQLSNIYHDQESDYGVRQYLATQRSFYANLIFQSYINNTNHIIKVGLSSVVDQYNETFDNQKFTRNEVVPGVFTEYAYNYNDKFNMVAGLRGDYDNLYGAFATPRLHLRYAPFKKTAIRASVGRAQHTANIFAENIGLMASNRHFIILSGDQGKAYGLNPEVAWNTGVNITQKFTLDYREGSISVDYYYTRFQNQVVVDEEYPGFVQFYNLQGQSFAHSFQVQLDYELLHNFNVRLAYRYYDVETDYQNTGLKQKPLIPANRAFTNLDYETKNGWKFDYTLQWIGEKRLFGMEHGGFIVKNSPQYIQMNAQITKAINKDLDIYLGGENLTNFMQHGDIISPEDPFAANFDASQIWGPVMGRNIYVGIRLKIK